MLLTMEDQVLEKNVFKAINHVKSISLKAVTVDCLRIHHKKIHPVTKSFGLFYVQVECTSYLNSCKTIEDAAS